MTIKCGYLGPPGTFSEEAALKYFQEEAELIPCNSFNQIFDKIQSGEVDRGVIPIENSLEGPVNLCMDLLFTNSFVVIINELIIPIRHYLLGLPGTRINIIKKIYSISQVIGQSNLFIKQNLPEVEVNLTGSSAMAAKLIDSHDKAMIGSARISALYNLEILAENVQDNLNNYTRFFIIGNKLDIGKQNREENTEYKTSIICAPEVNEAGALYNILGELAREEVNLTRIESRPTKRMLGEYLFYIDFEGHKDDPNIAKALQGVEKRSAFFKVLGSYKKGEIFKIQGGSSKYVKSTDE
jgi:prephenate dehydratase